VEKYRTAGQATDDSIKKRMRSACWINKVTDTNSEYVVLIATVVPRTCLNVTLYSVIKNFSVHLMITTQKVASNVQSVPRQSPDIY
jgi:hypothetical protein